MIGLIVWIGLIGLIGLPGPNSPEDQAGLTGLIGSKFSIGLDCVSCACSVVLILGCH